MNNLTVLPADDFLIKTDEQGNDWIVNKTTGAAYMSVTALFHCAEIDRAAISGMINKSRETPKALLGIDLSGVIKIENEANPEPYTAIPSDVCYEVIFYYGNEARGKDRPFARALSKTMGKAGAAVYIYGQAGYKVVPVDKADTTPTKPLSPLEMFKLQVQIAEEHEQRLLAIEAAQQEQKTLLSDLNKKMEEVSVQSQELTMAYQVARDYLSSIDTEGIEPLTFTLRTQLNRLVRAYCVVNNVAFRSGWNQLYRNFRDINRIDLKARASNVGQQTLDYAEANGYLELLMRIALQTFATESY